MSRRSQARRERLIISFIRKWVEVKLLTVDQIGCDAPDAAELNPRARFAVCSAITRAVRVAWLIRRLALSRGALRAE